MQSPSLIISSAHPPPGHQLLYLRLYLETAQIRNVLPFQDPIKFDNFHKSEISGNQETEENPKVFLCCPIS
jgi:hypothetical protein